MDNIDVLLDSRNKGQVFTPKDIVSIILDEVGYKGDETLKRSIIEPSFGDGAFLIQIINRIITESKLQDKSNDEIIKIIKSNVFGIEKDTKLFNITIDRLNTLLNNYGLDFMDWSNNLFNGDTLLLHSDFLNKFDYVVGNPPYIRIHNIDNNIRSIIDGFSFSDGTTDMYVMFYEVGLNMLNDNGKLGYITPNSFMRNTSQKRFRNHLIEKKYIKKIFDFKDSKIFKEADVYTCICILSKEDNKEIEYREYRMYDIVKKNNIFFKYFNDDLKDKPWNLSTNDDILFLKQNREKPIKLSDISNTQNGVATNKDSIYVSKAWIDKEQTIPYLGKHSDNNKIVYFNGFPIESKILHRCIKASKYNGVIANNYILFPYKTKEETINNEVEYIPLTENDLINTYPNAYEYLLKNKETLLLRNMDKGANWYQFGRSQGIKNSCYKKIVFKHIISKEISIIKPFIVDEDVIIYSGMFTTLNTDKNNIEELNKICDVIGSYDFTRYCNIVGKNMSNNYLFVNTKQVKEYGFSFN